MINYHSDIYHILSYCRKCSKTHLKGKTCNGAAVNFVGWDDLIGSHDKFTPPKGTINIIIFLA